LSDKWPPALKSRINNGTVSAIHIPFRKEAIHHACGYFSHNNYPKGGSLGVYNDATYASWGA
jgi:hypothetical protein